MPRRPTRSPRSLTSRPVTFSPFSRTVAHLSAACMKKRQLPPAISENETSSEEETQQSESTDEEVSPGEVNVDFVFADPKPDDFHGVKVLLRTYPDDLQWDLSGFVDVILEQNGVGTVVKIEDSEDGIFSVVTALNLARYKDKKCIMELKEFVLKVCKEKKTMDELRVLLGEQAHTVGLIVSQHVVNLPPQLLPNLYNGLFKEILWSTEDEPIEELKNSFRFKSYLLITKIYKHKNAGQKSCRSNGSNEPIIYIKPEDEIFQEVCSWSFNFLLHSDTVTPPEETGAEKWLYGLDDINGATEIIIVEGEMDKLSVEEAGFRNCVSVPSGAPQIVSAKDLPPSEKDRAFQYLWNCKEYLENVSRIILATDGDASGQALAEELARRLGRERCWIVRWPKNDNSCYFKDANEVLRFLGPAALREVIETAQVYQQEVLNQVV